MPGSYKQQLEILSMQEKEIVLLMYYKKHAEALKCIENISQNDESNQRNSTDLNPKIQILKSLCLMKLNRHNEAILNINSMKRNQWSPKLNIKALMLKMKAY